MSKIPVAVVIGERPTHTPGGQSIPGDWPIYNITRPLYGHLTWTDSNPPFRSYGWFFAAIDPAGEYASAYTEDNRRLDARQLEFVSDEAAFERGVAEAHERYGARLGKQLDDMVANQKYRDEFVRKGIESLAIEAEG